jgi:hypothetical protein
MFALQIFLKSIVKIVFFLIRVSVDGGDVDNPACYFLVFMGTVPRSFQVGRIVFTVAEPRRCDEAGTLTDTVKNSPHFIEAEGS